MSQEPSHTKDPDERIISCVIACRGIKDPEKTISHVRYFFSAMVNNYKIDPNEQLGKYMNMAIKIHEALKALEAQDEWAPNTYWQRRGRDETTKPS